MHILYATRLGEIHSENLSIWNFPTESNLSYSIPIRKSVPLRVVKWQESQFHILQSGEEQEKEKNVKRFKFG